MVKYKILIVLILGAISLGQLHAQQFTIKEAQDYALKNNKTFQNAAADVELAEAQLKEAKASGLPKIDGSVDYMTNFGYEFVFNLGGGDSEPPQIDFSKLDAGDYEVLKVLEGMTSGSASTIKMTDQASANIQVSQLIFSGQYWVGIEMAKLGKLIREKGLSLTALEIKEQVVNSYQLILVTQKLLNVIEKNENNLKEMYTHTNNLYQAGMVEKTDVDQIKINISQLENSRRAMSRNLELNFNMFRMLLGLEAGSEIQLSEDLNSLIKNLEGQMIPSEGFDVSENLNYQMLTVQERIGKKQIDMQKWAYAPTLVGFYSYKEKIMASAFDLSPNHAAGFTLSVPIFSGGSKNAKMTQARIELEKTARNISLLEDQLALQKNQLSFDLTNAYENYLTQKKNVEVAKEVYNSMLNKYRQGVISTLELTQANGNYLQAESNNVSAMMDLLKSKLALDKLYNNI
jgi:outer membrane protein